MIKELKDFLVFSIKIIVITIIISVLFLNIEKTLGKYIIKHNINIFSGTLA